VTARKEADQRLREAIATMEEASRLKSEFLSTMSHELRTPMNAIIGYAHLLLDGLSGELTEQQANDVDQIARSADRLLALIDDLLDISKIEAGRMELAPVLLGVGEMLARVRDELAPAAAAKGLDIAIDLPEGLPAIEADPARLHQILLNLAGNAVKFTARGRVAIRADNGEDWLVVSVTDTGIGIAPEALEFIFDEFRQADGSTTRRFGGTGLGLAIARKLARLHGGDITVVSTAGVGSTFTLVLPIVARNGSPGSDDSVRSPRKEFAG
jgi:signal transduction histidine kinase